MAHLRVCTFLSLLSLAGCAGSGGGSSLPPPSFAGPHSSAPPVRASMQARTAEVAAIAPAGSVSKQAVAWGWQPSVPARAWRWVVVHHSATPTGAAAAFDKMHRDKGWDELGYHFVIGNGTDTGDGQIEVGSRWLKQKYGAHAKTSDNRFNDYGIGICLVGNFDQTNPTPAQMQSLAKLTGFLMRTYRIRPTDVIGHGDTKPTDCPGRNMSLVVVRNMALRSIERSVSQTGPSVPAAGTELLTASTAR